MKRETIWVVDDDPIFRMIFKMTLKKCYPHFEVREYNHGKEACDAYSGLMAENGALPHSIFMDINMPVMNGWQCMDKMQALLTRDITQSSKLYIVSSSINPEDEKKANAYNVTSGYLVKPLTADVFCEIFD